MSRRDGKRFLKFWIGIAALISLFLMWILVCSAAEEPRRGGTLVLASTKDPSNLNMALTTDGMTCRPLLEIFEGLVELDRDMNPLPSLAQSWDVSPDGMTITFHLAKNVKWHDGKPFSSKDVKFSLMEVVGKYHPRGKTAMANVKDIETPDDNTVVLRMKRVYAPLFVALVTKNAPIIPRHLYEGTDILKNPHNFNDPVGTGAFKFKEWGKGDHLTLVRNEDYHKPGLPYLDRIIYKVIKDSNARAFAFEKGEIDFLDYLTTPYEEYHRLSSLPNVTSSPPYGETMVTFLVLNQKDNKILANLKVRQAIYHAIDRQFICNKARYGLNPPAYSPIPTSFRDFHNRNVKKYEYDPAKANKLLDEAGYPRGANGIRFAMSLSYEAAHEIAMTPAQILKPMLKEVGIDVRLVGMELPVLIDKVFGKYDYEMFLISYSTSGDPAVGIGRIYLTREIRPVIYVNVARYSNPEVDRLFDEAELTMDKKKRARAYYKIQEILTEELPCIWLYEWAQDTNLVKSTFKNCFQRSLSGQFAEVWWTGGK